MLRLYMKKSKATRLLLLVSQFVIALVATTPAFAQSSGTWTKTGSMNTPREGHSATLLQNGQVLVAGGLNNTGVIAGAELYDPKQGKWTVTGSMNAIRTGRGAVLLQNGQVLVVGGSGNTQQYLSSAELYNPATGTWTLTGSMSEARGGFSATLLPSGQVLVAGGVLYNGPILSSAELYNPATGTWTATGSMNQARVGQAAMLLANGKVLVAGGGGTSASLYSAELYDPATGAWTMTGGSNIAFAAFGMLLANGEALVTNQRGGGAQLYNLSTGTWTFDGSGNNSGSLGQTVTLLGTGMVLTCGGTSGVYPRPTVVLTACDLFDPSTRNDAPTGSMHVARDTHTATVLQNGQVLVAGGESQEKKGNTIIDFYTNTAELYTP